MIAVCYKENIAYTCKTRLEVEMEILQTKDFAWLRRLAV